MKKIIVFAFAILPQLLIAQGVAINSDGLDPVPSAMLEVTSNSKGILIPRMTAAERGAIASPADGLMVYQTDGATGFYYYSGIASVWRTFAASASNGLNINGTSGDVELGGTLLASTMVDLGSFDLTFWEGDLTLGRSSGADVLMYFSGDNNGVGWSIGVEDSNNADFIISNSSDFSDPKLFIGGGGSGLDGFIGLGTSTPENSLHLFNSSASPILKIDGPINGVGIDPTLRFTEVFSTDFGFDLYLDGDQNSLKFRSLESGLTVVDNILTMERSSGEVGFGTSTPARQVEIFSPSTTYLRVSGTGAGFASGGIEFNGTGSVDWRIVPALGILTFSRGDVEANSMTNEFFMNNTSFSPVIDASKSLGLSTQKWSIVYASNGIINTSDRRLKKEIVPLKYSLNQILSLNPVSFKWKNEKTDTKTHLGLIAQEVQEIIPEVIDVADNSEKSLGLNYTELIPVLVNAIKEQQGIIEDKEARIKSLEIRTQRQESSMEGLKSELNYIKELLDIKATTKKR